jgi:alpha-glucosidase
VASSGIRRDVRNGTIQTMWARDIQDPVDQNVYVLRFFIISFPSFYYFYTFPATAHIRFTLSTVLTNQPRSLPPMVSSCSGTCLSLPFLFTSDTFAHSAAGSDVLLLTPPNATQSLIEYRMIGGVLDFYFFSGPSPQYVIEQYGELVGFPTWQPVWGFGFQLCR